MTYKQYLRKVEKLERAGDSESLAALERELMENLDSNLDMDFVSAVDPVHYDEELEEEYGHLFWKNFIFNLTFYTQFDTI